MLMTCKDKIIFVRTIHSTFAIFFLLCIIYLYVVMLQGEKTILAHWAAWILIAEAFLLAINRGNCPLAYLHRRVGDEKGFFDLFIPPPVLPYTVPLLTILSGIAIFWLFFS